MRLRGHLTYSNVISTICLFLLLGGGTAWATAKVLGKESVGSKQLKKEAVTPAKLSKAAKTALGGSAGPRGEAGAQGPKGDEGSPGAPGEPATKLFAQIREDGTVNTSSVPVVSLRTAEGGYLVNFGQDISHCAVVGTEGSLPLFNQPGDTTGDKEGWVNVGLDSGPGESRPGFPRVDTVGVITHEEGAPFEHHINASFYLAVFC
jgi:hypothetical protein